MNLVLGSEWDHGIWPQIVTSPRSQETFYIIIIIFIHDYVNLNSPIYSDCMTVDKQQSL